MQRQKLIFILQLLAISIPLSAQWSVINRDIEIRKILFINDSIGYLVGSHDVYKTTNSGKDWNNILTTTDDVLNSISFPNDSIGYIGGADTHWARNRIYKTTDAGLTWNIYTLPTHLGYLPGLDDICFINSDTGFVTSGIGYNEFFKTTDGGISWTRILMFGELTNFFKLNDSTVYVTGGSKLMKTNDFGKTWNAIYIYPFYDDALGVGISSCFFINESVGFLVGCDFMHNYVSIVLKTIDGGMTWQYQDFFNCRGFTTSFNSVYFTSDSIGYVCGDCGIIMKTKDQGKTWKLFQMSNAQFYSTYFTNINTGYVGGGDFLLKTTNSGGDSFQPFELEGQKYFIYPNPFHDNINVEINGCLFAETSFIFEIYDIIGNIVYYHKIIGSTSTIIDCSKLTNGLYIYRLLNTNNSVIEKGKIIKY